MGCIDHIFALLGVDHRVWGSNKNSGAFGKIIETREPFKGKKENHSNLLELSIGFAAAASGSLISTTTIPDVTNVFATDAA